MEQPESRTIARVDTAIRVRVFMVEFLGLSNVRSIIPECYSILLHYTIGFEECEDKNRKIAGMSNLFISVFAHVCVSCRR